MAKIDDFVTVTKPLKYGLKIGSETHKDVVVRDGNLADFFAAEKLASTDQTVTFEAALLIERIIRVGTFDGTLTMDIMGRLRPADFSVMRAAMKEAETLGESTPEATPGT